MANYTPTEVVDILITFGECGRNYRLTARTYAERFPNRRHPTDQQIINIERRSRNNPLHRERRRNRLHNNNDPRLLAVLAMVHQNPHISTRQIERELGIPQTTAHRLLRSVNYHPYHITLVQELSEADYVLRVQFCRWALEMLDQNPDFFSNVCFSDEATFMSNGSLNRHNCHYWSPENPHWYREVLNQHRWSLYVWVGICNGQVIGPHFFERPINSPMYLEFLENDLPAYLGNVPLAVRLNLWYQQDGAPAHHARIVRMFLNQRFPNRWIGRGGPVLWPPRSPDLNPLDFFLWEYVKDAVYSKAPTTRLNMMERIRRACEAITPLMLENVQRNFRCRLLLSLENNGAHFEHLLHAERADNNAILP